MYKQKEITKKQIVDVPGFVSGYAHDPDSPQLDYHIFIIFDVRIENALLDKQFALKYGDKFVTTYVKHIDFKPYNIYVFKRDLDIMSEILSFGDIKYELPLEDDESLYLPDDYSFTIKK